MTTATPDEDPIWRMLEQQRRLNDLMTGGPVRRMLDQQRQINETLSGGAAVQRMVEQQRRLTGMSDAVKAHQRLNEMMTGGAVGRMFEQQKQLAELMRGGTIQRVLEAQRQFSERLNSSMFDAYRDLAAETVAEGIEAADADTTSVDKSSVELDGWVPTRSRHMTSPTSRCSWLLSCSTCSRWRRLHSQTQRRPVSRPCWTLQS